MTITNPCPGSGQQTKRDFEAYRLQSGTRGAYASGLYTPMPRVECPACGRWVAVTSRGLKAHKAAAR